MSTMCSPAGLAWRRVVDGVADVAVDGRVTGRRDLAVGPVACLRPMMLGSLPMSQMWQP